MRSPNACRDAVANDLDELLRLEAQFPGDRLSHRQLRFHLARGRGLRVLPANRGLRGYSLTLFRRDSERARLYSLVVDRAARGLGLGRLLLADAEALARHNGSRALRLEVRADNAAALALYLAAGYLRCGGRAGYYEDGMDAVQLEKSLPSAEHSPRP
jgi:ribosomal protein S18 acetylase RimI-like enzyme